MVAEVWASGGFAFAVHEDVVRDTVHIKLLAQCSNLLDADTVMNTADILYLGGVLVDRR